MALFKRSFGDVIKRNSTFLPSSYEQSPLFWPWTRVVVLSSIHVLKNEKKSKKKLKN